MSDSDETQADTSAETAYAKASESVPVTKPNLVEAVEPAAQTAKPATAVDIPSVKPAPAKPKVEAKVAKPEAVKPARAVAAKAKAAPKPVVAPKVAAAPKVKPVAPAKPAAKKAPVKAASLASIAPKITPPKTTSKTTPKITIATTLSASAANKDKTMTISKNVTTGFESIISDAQVKAKEAFEKSTAFFGDYADFTKGNLEAVVQSGKILAGGLQSMGSEFVAESRSAFEAASADIKGLAAAKSPTDLIQLQSEIVRKSFDSAVAYGSKNTEAMIKLTSEVFAPISSRMSLAVEKVRTAAI